jgi:hypothetical protein
MFECVIPADLDQATRETVRDLLNKNVLEFMFLLIAFPNQDVAAVAGATDPGYNRGHALLRSRLGQRDPSTD